MWNLRKARLVVALLALVCVLLAACNNSEGEIPGNLEFGDIFPNHTGVVFPGQNDKVPSASSTPGNSSDEGNQPPDNSLDEDNQMPDEDENASKGLFYQLSEDGTYYILKSLGTCEDTQIVISAVYKGLPVREIADSVFRGEKHIQSIHIPQSIVNIGKSAFSGCEGLTELTIPSGVVSIGATAFSGCENLAKISIADSVTTIGEKVFSDCTALTEITIPDGVTSLGEETFRDCTALRKIKLSESATYIGVRAFRDCTALEEIVIPNSVQELGASIFSGCTALTRVVLGDNLRRIPEQAFYNCANLQDVTIGKGTTHIGKEAFGSCKNLRSIYFPEGVTHLEDNVFLFCSNLRFISLPESLEFVEHSAIDVANSPNIQYTEYKGGLYLGNENNPYVLLRTVPDSEIKNFEVHPDTKHLGFGAFERGPKIRSVKLPEGLISIGYAAFRWQGALESITIPESTKYIDEGAFLDCTSLREIAIPKNVIEIRSGIFEGCKNLKKITVASDNPKYHSIDNCIIETQTKCLVAALSDAVIPADGSVTIIGQGAINKQAKLKTIYIPEGVTEIADWGVYNCAALENITIPSTMKKIGHQAFGSWDSMPKDKNITYNGTMAQWDAMEKNEFWDDGMGNYTVHCTDGDISKNIQSAGSDKEE